MRECSPLTVLPCTWTIGDLIGSLEGCAKKVSQYGSDGSVKIPPLEFTQYLNPTNSGSVEYSEKGKSNSIENTSQTKIHDGHPACAESKKALALGWKSCSHLLSAC